MNQIRYLSLVVLMLCGIMLWGETSAMARVQADKTKLTVVADPPEGGSVSGGGSYEAGTAVQLRASAASGFQFVSWTRDGEVVSTANNFKYTKGDGDETLVAHFIYNPSSPSEPNQPDIKKKYVLNLLTEEGGYNLNGAGTYAEGTRVSVSVGTENGFVFLGWYDSSETLVSDKTSFSYTIMGNETLTARFKYDPNNPSEPDRPNIKQNFVLTLLTEEGGYNVSGAGTYQEGTAVGVRVYTETGYAFTGWYDSKGTLVSDKASFTYTITGHATLTARFKYTPDSPDEPSQPDIKERHRITVTAVPSDGGTASVDEAIVMEGERTRVRATANTGFVFLGWFAADTLFQSSADFYYTMGKKDIALEARFEYNPDGPAEPSVPDNRKYSIYLTTVRGLPGRTVQYPIYLSSLDSLTNMQFNITFPKGLTPDVENVKLSGKAQGYTLTWQEVAVATDETQNAPRRAADRETAYQFTLTGGKLPACNTRLMTIDVAISEDADTTKQVKINQVTVTDTDGNNTTASTRNGSVVMNESSGDGTYYYLTLISTGSGQASVNSRAVRNSLYVFDLLEGSSINVYFTPDNGYHIERVTLDDDDITDQVRQNSRYLFSNVNTDATLTVQFAEGASNAYDLTVKATGQGTVTYIGQEIRDAEQVFSVSHGAQVELSITPDEGYRVSQVMLNEASDVTSQIVDGKFVIESMTGANSIAVSFEQNPKVESVTIDKDGYRLSMSTTTENATIHYTQTGVEGVQTYTEALTLTDDCTLQAWAERDGYNNSDTTQLVFVKADVTVATPVLARRNNKVGISCTTEQAIIHYTMDGTVPTAASQVYADSIEVSQNCIIKAIALRENWFDSAVDSLVVDLFKVQNVVFAQDGNRLSMSTATENATIHYTQTGVEGVQTYTETLTLMEDCTIQAWAIRDGYNNSDTTQLVFVKADVTVATPVLARSNNKVGISCTTEQAVIHYTMDGSEPTVASQVYADSIVVNQNCTIKAIALRENWFDSAVDSLVVDLFKVQNVVFAQDGNRLSMSTATENATIHYTQTGVEGVQTYTETLTLMEDCSIDAWATRDGYNNSDTTQLVFVKADVTVATPVLARRNNKVGISCTTEQAVIHYTMDGTVPTAASQVYADSIEVNQNCIIKAIALRENWFDSAVDSLAVDLFKVDTVTIAPNGYRLTMSTTTDNAVIHYVQSGVDGEQIYTDILTLTQDCSIDAWATREGYNNSDTVHYSFSKAGVTVATPALVRRNNKVGISCTTEQAVIHYTMDGSEPTAASQVYADSIEVNQNCIIKAIALRENWFDSAVDSLVVDLFKVQNVIFAQDGNRLSMSTATENATIHYTQTGVEGVQTYTEALTLMEDCTIQAWATREGYSNSDTTCYEFIYTPMGEALFDGQVAMVSGERTLDEAFESVGGRAEAAKTITAIIWDKETVLTTSDLEGLDNPNLLLFVNHKELADATLRNLVVNGEAGRITLTDTGTGNCDFYSPREFRVEHIEYTREFRQETQIGVSRGWEAIALPFTVQTITHERQGVIAPFGVDGSDKHFWLRMLSPTGLTRATQIEANMPYVISMPNSDEYKGDDYYLNGRVTFSAENAVVPATIQKSMALADSSIVMMPAMQRKDRSSVVWALNVGQVRGQYLEGSVFERDYREVRPFEAYTVHRGTAAPRFLPIQEIQSGDMTGISSMDDGQLMIDNWYSLDGRKLQQKPSRKGVYIRNGRKVALKFVK